MKKLIIGVVAIVLLLGVNFASAMKVLPPLAIAEPLNAFEQQIWNDIQILQTQISNLAQRLTVVEQKPASPSLKVYDANNQLVGYFSGFSNRVEFLSEMPVIFDPVRKEMIYVRADGKVGPQWNANLSSRFVYDGPNCTGNNYIYNEDYLRNPDFTAYFYYPSIYARPIHLRVATTTINIHILSQYSPTSESCSSMDTTAPVRTYVEDPIPDFAGPLEIRAE